MTQSHLLEARKSSNASILPADRKRLDQIYAKFTGKDHVQASEVGKKTMFA